MIIIGIMNNINNIIFNTNNNIINTNIIINKIMIIRIIIVAIIIIIIIFISWGGTISTCRI